MTLMSPLPAGLLQYVGRASYLKMPMFVASPLWRNGTAAKGWNSRPGVTGKRLHCDFTCPAKHPQVSDAGRSRLRTVSSMSVPAAVDPNIAEPDEVLVLFTQFSGDADAMKAEVQECLRYVVFSGDVTPAAPMEIGTTAEGEASLLYLGAGGEPTSRLIIRCDPCLNFDDLGDGCILSVSRQRMERESITQSSPGWRSLIRKFSTEMQRRLGEGNVRVMYIAPYIRLGRKRRNYNQAGQKKHGTLLTAMLPPASITSVRQLVMSLQDWGMGMQFSSEGGWLSLRPTPPFSVYPKANGVEIMFNPDRSMKSKNRLDVKVIEWKTSVNIVAVATNPTHHAPKSMTEKLRNNIRREYPEAKFRSNR